MKITPNDSIQETNGSNADSKRLEFFLTRGLRAIPSKVAIARE